ncbi:MAG: type III-A CRISPR-associated RAMP protein Csm5, partial [Bacteroidota bacterium]
MKLITPQVWRMYTLSPLHIGTGETLSPLDYIVHGNTFYRIRQEELYELVQEHIDGGTRDFASWIGEQMSAMRNLRDNRAQSDLNNKTNALTYFQNRGKQRELLQALQQRPQGGQMVLLDDQNQHRNRQGPKLGDVREAIRTGGQAYLPGSSIKGSIRTALLYDYLQRHGDIAKLEPLIHRQLTNSRTRKEYFASPLEAEVFFCPQEERGKIRPQEAQMDLLKWLSVSDAYATAAPALEVGKINLYLVEKEQRQRRPTGRLLAARQPQASYAEMIPTGCELRTTVQFDTAVLVQLLQRLDKGKIEVRGNTYYHALTTRLKRLFDLSDEQLKTQDAPALQDAILAHCQAAVARFSQAQWQRQQAWLDDYASQQDPENFGPRIQSGSQPIAGHAGPQFHLGYAAGFNATTVLLYFLQKDDAHRQLFERIMAKYELGKAPGQKGRYVPKISRFPKSRRLVEKEHVIQPLGWLALLRPDESLPA